MNEDALVVRSQLRRRLMLLGAVASVWCSGRAADALTINLTYDSSVAALGTTESANVESACQYVANQYDSMFTNNYTLDINVTVAPGTSTLGESVGGVTGFFSYSQIRTALIANDPADLADLPATDPLSSISNHMYALPVSEGQALGLISNTTPVSDTFVFGGGYTYTFDPANRAVANEIDFIGVAEHGFSELMGRIPGLGTDFFSTGNADYLPYDLFRYSAAGTRDVTNGAGAYFSLDNGTTNLKSFNDAADNGGDPQDWASGTNDSYNAFTGPGVEDPVTAVDIQAMNAIGYVSAVPEPASLALFSLATAGALLRRRRSR